MGFASIHLDPEGGAQIEVALGGHPSPIHIHQQRTDNLGQPGTILGLIPPKVHTTTHRLEPDDTVVFCTDGITGAPTGQQLDHADLHRLFAGLHDPASSTIRQAIRCELTARRPNGNTDDTAVLIIRSTPSQTTSDTQDHFANATS